MVNLFASLAEFARDIIRKRTKAGPTAARARGRQGGRPEGLTKEVLSKAQAAKLLYLQQEKSWPKSANCLGWVDKAYSWRYAMLVPGLTHLEVPTGSKPLTEYLKQRPAHYQHDRVNLAASEKIV